MIPSPRCLFPGGRRFFPRRFHRPIDNDQVNVQIIEDDAYASALTSEAFDFTHARFLIGPVGGADVLLPEMVRITKPGGVIGLEEPDTGSWTNYPQSCRHGNGERQRLRSRNHLEFSQ